VKYVFNSDLVSASGSGMAFILRHVITWFLYEISPFYKRDKFNSLEILQSIRCLEFEAPIAPVSNFIAVLPLLYRME
jgi:hypothetical protein